MNKDLPSYQEVISNPNKYPIIPIKMAKVNLPPKCK